MSRTCKTDPWIFRAAAAKGVRLPKFDRVAVRPWMIVEEYNLHCPEISFRRQMLDGRGKKTYRKICERRFRARVRDDLAHGRYDTLPNGPDDYDWDMW